MSINSWVGCKSKSNSKSVGALLGRRVAARYRSIRACGVEIHCLRTRFVLFFCCDLRWAVVLFCSVCSCLAVVVRSELWVIRFSLVSTFDQQKRLSFSLKLGLISVFLCFYFLRVKNGVLTKWPLPACRCRPVSGLSRLAVPCFVTGGGGRLVPVWVIGVQ